MLKIMRDNFRHLSWILWLTILVFLAFVFVDWGMGRIGGGPGVSLGDDAARVGDTRISARDFIQSYRATEDRYRQTYQTNFTPALIKALDLPNQVLNGMIDQALMVDLARKAGVTASDDEVAQRIAAIPGMKRNGQFIGAEEYRSLLAANGLRPEKFEQDVRNEIIMRKFSKLVAASLVVPDSAVRQEFARQNERAKIDYVLLPYDKFSSTVGKPTEKELADFYARNKEAYRQPEKRELKYLLVDNTRLRQKTVITQKDIQDYYDTNASQFQIPEQVHAAHILIKVDPNATPAEQSAAEKKAAEVAQKARSGADFSALAKKYSEDPGSKDKGGDLGTFGKGQMVPAFDQAVFSMKPGEIRGPVRTKFGYHIIKLIDKTPAHEKPLEEVQNQIRLSLETQRVNEQADKIASALADRINRDKLTSDADLRKLTTDIVTFNATDWVSANEPVPGLGYSPKLSQTAFSLKKGEVARDTVPTPRGPAIIKVADIKASGIAPLSEVRDKVAADWTHERESAAAVAAATPDIAASMPLADIGKKYGTQVRSSPEFAPGSPIPDLGTSQPLSEAVFATAEGQVGKPVPLPNRGVVVFKVTEKREFDPAVFERQKETIRASLRSQQAEKYIESLLEQARAGEKIVINHDLLKRYEEAG
jgi:peptidyl-prolyl cis-trans isomerase D